MALALHPSMHCPHCAHDNAPIARFCGGCGAVLVENAGRRLARRVLRRFRAASVRTVPVDPSPVRRAPLLLAALAVAAALGLYASFFGRPSSTIERRPLVPLPVASRVRTDPTASELRTIVEPLPGPWSGPVDLATDARPPRVPARSRQSARETQAAVEAPASSVDRQPVATSGDHIEPAREAASVDRWTRVEQEIARCRERNLFERVICVEQVRLANCSGHWGSAPHCPGAQVVDYPR